MSSPSSASKGKSAVLCQAPTSFKKKNGTLTLTKTHLLWHVGGPNEAPAAGNGSLSFSNERLSTLFISKEGGAKVVMKVNILDIPGGANEESFNFAFISGPSAVSDREHFKREISGVISRNKANTAAAISAHTSTSAAPSPSAELAGATSPTPGSPSASGSGSAAFGGLPSPAQAAAQAGSIITARDPTKDLAVRKKILMDNPDLYALHVDLVRSGQMSEEEFWEGREYMLQAEFIAQSIGNNPGRSAQIVDPKPEQTESGDVKITLTKNLIKDIFDQYPIVQKAYNDNVPEPLAEAEFWHRYFHSKLFDRHHTSGRSSITSQASIANLKDDSIFDKYLEDPDDDLEPRNFQMRQDDIYRLLDLAATQEDHGDSDNVIKDFTMRAGGQKKSLPLMRRFNEHSERLLAQALGMAKGGTNALGHLHGGDAGSRKYYDDIVLEDLQGDERDEIIPLNVGDQSDAYSGAASSAATANDISGSDKENKRKRTLTDSEAEGIWEESRQRLRTYRPDLGHYHFSKKAASNALQSLQANIEQKLTSSSSSVSSTFSQLFPEHVLRAMISCQAAANEFLRHFWSAVLPARPDDISASALATPAQKAGKATRMVEYLQKTQERVDTVVNEAKKANVDEAAVREALQPVLGAVKKALEYYYSRVKGK